MAQTVKNPPALWETQGQEDPLEEGMATHSSILAWRIPWTDNHRRSLAGYTVYGGCKELDTTKRLILLYGQDLHRSP